MLLDLVQGHVVQPKAGQVVLHGHMYQWVVDLVLPCRRQQLVWKYSAVVNLVHQGFQLELEHVCSVIDLLLAEAQLTGHYC